MRVITTDSGRSPRGRSRRRSASGSTRTPRTRISSAPQSSAASACRSRRSSNANSLEHLEAADPRRQPIPGQVRDVGVELPQPVACAVVAHQAGPDHGAVGIDDPSPGRPHRTFVRFGVGDLFAAIEDARPAADTRSRQPGRPQACLPDRPVIRRHLDFAVETEAPHVLEIDSGGALYDEIPAAVGVDQLAKPGPVLVEAQPPPAAVPARRVDDDHSVAGNRMQRVGAAEVGGRPQVVARHRQPQRVDVAAHRAHARAEQRGQFGADRAGRVVHQHVWAARPTCQPTGAVQGHRRRGGLLQRLIGEQPVRHVTQLAQLAQFFQGAAAQQRRLHQHRRPITEPGARRGDVGDPGSVGQLEFGDGGQRRGTRFRPQVADVLGAEAQPAKTAAQEGLTPVIITL